MRWDSMFPCADFLTRTTKRAHACILRVRAPDMTRQVGPVFLFCARAFESVGDAEEAERTWRMAFERLRNATQFKALIQSAILNGEQETTRRLLTHIERQFTDDPDLLDYCGQTRVTFGDLEGAERVFRAALAGARQTPELLAHLGNLLVRRKNLDEAAAVLEKARALDPRNANVLRTLACIGSHHAETPGGGRA